MEFVGNTLASHFLAEVGTNVCVKKRVSKEYRSFAHGLRDPLASLDQGEFLIEAVRTQCQLPNIRMAE